MLFAQTLFAVEHLDPGSQTLAIGGWVGGALSVVGTLVTSYLTYRLSRDRLQLDADKIRMGARIEVLEASVAKGEAECQKRLDVVHQQVVTVRMELAVEQGKTRRLEEQIQNETTRRRQTVGALANRVDQLDPSKSQGGSSLSGDVTPAG